MRAGRFEFCGFTPLSKQIEQSPVVSSDPYEHSEHGAYREQQKPITTRSILERTAPRTHSGVDLLGQWHQTSRSNRVF